LPFEVVNIWIYQPDKIISTEDESLRFDIMFVLSINPCTDWYLIKTILTEVKSTT